MEILRRMQTPSRLLVLATLSALAVGFGLGRLSVLPTGERAAGRGEPRGLETSLPRGEAASRPSSDTEAAAQPSILDDPAALARIREMAESAVSWGASPKRVVNGLIEQMDEDELVSMVTSLTDYSREELENVEDIHAFAARLAEVAMDGTVVPAEDLGPEVQHVSFTGEVMDDNSPVSPHAATSESTRRGSTRPFPAVSSRARA
jgi:hypothetical protein